VREAVELLFHVGVGEPLEIEDERLRAAIELLVKAIDCFLVEQSDR